MRRGFTLIEVIVAVAILSVAAMAIFNLGLQSTQITQQLKHREALIGPLSIAALHGTMDHHGLERELGRLLGEGYTIEHEGLRNYLRQSRVTYRQHTLERIDLIPGGEESGWDLPRFELIERQVQVDGVSVRLIGIQPER